MISEKKVVNAMGGKTARACDGCLRKRARWYCAADDAFLCQGCDTSVHSANQLASRHERVRLEVASSKLNGVVSNKDTTPGWHQGFTRKARTPRTNKAMLLQQQAKEAVKELNSNESLVPEIGSEEGSLDEKTEEQLLYQVPILDPFTLELDCDAIGSEGKVPTAAGNREENKIVDGFGQEGACDCNDQHGFLQSDVDLAEFAADVESFLDDGAIDEDSSDVKELVLLDCKEENYHNAVCLGDKVAVKIKDKEVEGLAAIDWNYDYESPVIGEEVKPAPQADTAMMNTKYYKSEMKKNVSLKLNYDAVITAWASQGYPWTTGSRPEFNHNCLPDCMGSCYKDVHYPYKGLLRHIGGVVDGGREARVSRYREKRRTRLFSKKIRYEVRKLNAEKRPRMKGRFVKRTSFVGTNINAFPNYLNK